MNTNLLRNVRGPMRISSSVKYAALTIVSLFAMASSASAHVRWFVDGEAAALANYPVYDVFEGPVLIWCAIGAFLILTAIVLDGRFPVLPIVNTKIRHEAIELLRVCTGMSLLFTAYGGSVIAPHLDAYGGFGVLLLAIQLAVGILFLTNHFLSHASGLLIVLLIGMMTQYDVLSGLEYINMIGIALFIFFNNAPGEALRAKLKPYSVDVLRICTGIALVTLGVTEKILGTVMAQAFLAEYNWNFMAMAGLDWYTDQLFVLSAGAMEVVFGTIMVLGVVTRLNTFVLSLFLLASNITFLLVNENENALMELIGHMPVIASAVIFLLLGYGQRLKMPNPTVRKQAAPLADMSE